MNTKSVIGRTLVVVAVTMLAWMVVAAAQEAAQDSDQLALTVANAQKANQAELAKYSWKVSTSISKEGKEEYTSVSEMRFGDNGKIDATTLESKSDAKKERGLRKHVEEKKIDEFASYLESVIKHSSQYIFMSKGTLVDMFDRAKITRGESDIHVAATDVFVKGDQVKMSVDSASNLEQKLSFTTTLDKDTIMGDVTFAKMEDGPSKATEFVLTIPTQSLKIKAETYDWMKQE